MIRQLSDDTIAKIKAGEVIDRPASIVKELIENSLDSGATHIDIDIINGGKTSIRVTDNGAGISVDDLPLAPIRHATSKLETYDDLSHALTMGFRGEALASMSQVATVTISSRIAGADAYQITADDMQIGAVTPTNHSMGTTVDVADLFSKIPARKKFLKSDTAESSAITELVEGFSLLYPHITWKYTQDRKVNIDTQGMDITRRLAVVMGKSAGTQFIPLSFSTAFGTISGMTGSPQLTFPNRKRQWISVNGRWIRSGTLSQAIANAYRDWIPHNRFAAAVLHLSIPPDRLDVNIHPQKQDIKFADAGAIFDLIRFGIAQSISPTTIPASPLVLPNTSESQATYSTFEFQPQIPRPQPSHFSSAQILPLFEFTPPKVPPTYFQLLDTYIFIRSENCVWVMDQHAVHERILYEKFKTKQLGQIAMQPLLIGEVMALSHSQYAVWQDHHPLLGELGIDTEPFGNSQIIIRQIPVVFTHIAIQPFIETLLIDLEMFPAHTVVLTDFQKEDLQLKACKAAIKAGQALSDAEITHMITDFMASPANYTCPHGRPLCIQLDKAKLEKLFMRT